jgi:hypothetical protein
MSLIRLGGAQPRNRATLGKLNGEGVTCYNYLYIILYYNIILYINNINGA